MSLISILETIFIGPLKLIFEIIFEIANRFVGHPGLAIIFLSLIMNILVLPLYRRADAMQEESRDIEAKLHDGVAHIKKTFSGDERMMILQTYYRQNHYKPTDALNGSVSLLLEIPFFMAAYQFLSHLDILNGVSFGPIADLGAPDGLLVIGGIAINVLPILMTLVNVISSALYLKGFPLKTKIQLYGMALFFLVFLYTSPSCLVFYWTLNNVFSLVKTIFYKLKNPQKVLRILTSIIGVGFLAFGFIYDTTSLKRRLFLFGIGVLLQLPLLWPVIRAKLPHKENLKQPVPNRKLFVLGCVFLTVLVGLLIPSTFIAASPQEYVDLTYFHNPLWYLVSSASLAAGTFLVWMGVFYWLASAKGKAIFDKLVWALCGITLVNYMFFGTDLGIISASLEYENGMAFSLIEQLVNIAVIVAVAVLLYLFIRFWKRAVAMVLATAIIAVGGMSALNIFTINTSVQKSAEQQVQDNAIPEFELSRDGQNVVVIMLDRALGQYVPYIMNEKPELKKQFAGFTYYSNTISFGKSTNFGSPVLFGGYEYTPVEMNKRANEKLAQKQNEALRMMPVLFDNNGFDVTVLDPVYANYNWTADVSIYDEYPDIDAYVTKGKFGDVNQKKMSISKNHRNFFCFSVMKSMPLFLQPTIYNKGLYNQPVTSDGEMAYTTQTVNSVSVAKGISAGFMESYNVLGSMSQMTTITSKDTDTFLMMSNDLPHAPMLLQTPDYVPAQEVNNMEYDKQNTDRFTADGKTIVIENSNQMRHYHVNMATLLQLGEWFDHLRKEGVYDNTKIILVADHGYGLWQDKALQMKSGAKKTEDVAWYFPLLLVKDFNADEYTASDEFMTIADVPTLAVKDLIENAKNPFTGKEINSNEKTAHEQFIITEGDWDTTKNNGKTYQNSRWASVKDDLWDPDSWTFYPGYMILDEHKAPTETLN